MWRGFGTSQILNFNPQTLNPKTQFSPSNSRTRRWCGMAQPTSCLQPMNPKPHTLNLKHPKSQTQNIEHQTPNIESQILKPEGGAEGHGPSGCVRPQTLYLILQKPSYVPTVLPTITPMHYSPCVIQEIPQTQTSTLPKREGGAEGHGLLRASNQ